MFSLALVVDGESVVGVSYDPFLDKMYMGKIGEKSYCNDTILSVSNLDFTSGVFAVTGNVKALLDSRYVQCMINDNVRLACFSGAVYKSCLVARGRFIGFADSAVNVHDMAAVQVIVEGAGGKVTGMKGETLDYSKPFKGAAVSNGITHNKIIEYFS